MGQEIACQASWGSERSAGKAQLEGDHVLFRGSFRVKALLKDATSVEALDGVLRLALPAGTLALELGPQAAKWAHKILHPPSRLDKLGVKPQQRVALLGTFDPAFAAELQASGATLDAAPPCDLVFFAAPDRTALASLARAAALLAPAGGLWIVYPKGVKVITEMQVLEAGRDVGLKDTKVAAFSATHTALRFVIPKSAR